MALALAYMVAQSRQQARPDDPPPDMIAVYRKCFDVVTGPEIDTFRTGAAYRQRIDAGVALAMSRQGDRGRDPRWRS